MDSIPNKVRSHILVILFFFLCVLVFTYPSLLHLNTYLIGDGGDTVEYLSYIYLFHKQVSSHSMPFSWSTIYRYPEGFDFELGSDARLFVFLGGVFLPFLGDVLTYNLLILILLTFNGYASWLFFKEITGSAKLGLIGGLIYGLSYYVLAKGAGHVNLMQVYALPLVGYAFYRIMHHKIIRWRDSSLIAFSLILLTLSTLQYLIISVAYFLVAMLVALIIYAKEFIRLRFHVNWPFLLKIGLPITSAICIILLIFPSHFQQSQANYLLKAKSIEREYWAKSPTIDSFLMPNSFLLPAVFHKLKKIKTIPLSIENSLYIGHIELSLFLIAFIFLPKRKSTLFLIIITFIFFYLPLLNQAGENLSFPLNYIKQVWPFYLIFDWQRFYVLSYLTATALILLLLKLFSVEKNLLLLILLIAGFSLERTSFNYFQVPISNYRGRPFEKKVAEARGLAVLDVPISLNENYVSNSEYNLLPFFYRKNLVQGFFHWPAITPGSKSLINSEEFSRFYCSWQEPQGININYHTLLDQKLAKKMKQLEITILVIHRRIFYDNSCRNLRKRTALLVKDLTQNEADLDDETYTDLGASTIINSYYFKRVYTDEDAFVYQLK